MCTERTAHPIKDVGENRWFTKCKKGYCRDRNVPWEYDGEDDPNKHDLYIRRYAIPKYLIIGIPRMILLDSLNKKFLNID